MVLLGWLQSPVISQVAFKRPRPASCHFPSSLGGDGMGPLRPSCDSNQGCPAALLSACQEEVLNCRSGTGSWHGGLCSPGFKVRQEDFGWPMGKGLETGGAWQGWWLCLWAGRGRESQSSLEATWNCLGLEELEEETEKPLCSFLPHPCTPTRQDNRATCT